MRRTNIDIGTAPRVTMPHAGEAAALAALAVLVLTLGVSPITDYDLFLHLKTGAVVLESGRVPRVDDYSALARGRPFVAHEWLSGVLFHAVERGFGRNGFAALSGLTALAALLTAAALYEAARFLGASPAAAVPLLALSMVLAAARLTPRPHVLSYLLTAVFLLVLAGRRAGWRIPPWTLLLLQVLWANLHGSFLLGPLIVGLAAAGEAIDARFAPKGPEPVAAGPAGRSAARRPGEARRLALLAAGLVAVSLVNPYGARLLAFPFRLTGSDFMGTIYEWRPPFGSAYAGTYMARYYILWILLGTATLLSALYLAGRRRLAPPAGAFGFLLFGVFLALSLRMNRAVTDFALATFPVVAGTLTRVARERGLRAGRLPILPLAALAMLGLAAWFGWNGYPFRPGSRRPPGLGIAGNVPVRAADYLEANGVRGTVFNSYGAGPYLIWRLYPSIRVVMDSRNDVYGDDLYAGYRRALGDAAALDEMLRRLETAAVLLEWVGGKNLATARLLRRAGDWRPVYFDDAALVYLRSDGERRDLVERDGYALLDPARFRPGRLRPEEAPRALEEAERAVRASRGSAIALVMKVDALLALDRRAEALQEEARIQSQLPYIHSWLGDMHVALGDRERAAARYRQALALHPAWPAALEGLEATRRPR
jgi:hypothetical protein